MSFKGMPSSRDLPIKGKQTMKYKEKAVLFRKEVLSEKNPAFQVLYIGNEFCERLLPEPAELLEILDWCSHKKIKPVLTTSFLTNEGIKKIRVILEAIRDYVLSCEIVINDWGALEMINNYSPELKLWIGRMITSRYKNLKIFDDIRPLLHLFFKERVKIPGLLFDFLITRNVVGMEFNSPYYLACNYKEFKKRGYKMAVHIPYMYLTVTRYCNCLNGYSGYFRDSIISCKRECKEYTGILHRHSYLENILSKGNAYFKEITLQYSKDALILDRVIFNDSLIPSEFSAQLKANEFFSRE